MRVKGKNTGQIKDIIYKSKVFLIRFVPRKGRHRNWNSSSRSVHFVNSTQHSSYLVEYRMNKRTALPEFPVSSTNIRISSFSWLPTFFRFRFSTIHPSRCTFTLVMRKKPVRSYRASTEKTTQNQQYMASGCTSK